MGIKNFTKIFEPIRVVKEEPGTNMAIDAYIELYRAGSVQNNAGLVNIYGQPTTHINVLISNISRRFKKNTKDIWCFDNRGQRDDDDMKNKELEKRQAVKDVKKKEKSKLVKKIKDIKDALKEHGEEILLTVQPEYKNTITVLEKQLINMEHSTDNQFGTIVDQSIYILSKLGITVYVAPKGCDAEKLAVHLCDIGKCDAVMTTDTDVMAYGAENMYKKVSKKTGQYQVYNLEHCLKQHDITRQQLAEIATVIGCDFCPKTKGVGPATVIKKVKAGTIVYTEEQIKAQQLFLEEYEGGHTIIKEKATLKSIQEIERWLVDEQSFTQKRIDTLLKPFYKKLKQ